MIPPPLAGVRDCGYNLLVTFEDVVEKGASAIAAHVDDLIATILRAKPLPEPIRSTPSGRVIETPFESIPGAEGTNPRVAVFAVINVAAGTAFQQLFRPSLTTDLLANVAFLAALWLAYAGVCVIACRIAFGQWRGMASLNIAIQIVSAAFVIASGTALLTSLAVERPLVYRSFSWPGLVYLVTQGVITSVVLPIGLMKVHPRPGTYRNALAMIVMVCLGAALLMANIFFARAASERHLARPYLYESPFHR